MELYGLDHGSPIKDQNIIKERVEMSRRIDMEMHGLDHTVHGALYRIHVCCKL